MMWLCALIVNTLIVTLGGACQLPDVSPSVVIGYFSTEPVGDEDVQTDLLSIKMKDLPLS